jgi:hypothetical protein
MACRYLWLLMGQMTSILSALTLVIFCSRGPVLLLLLLPTMSDVGAQA